MSSDSYRAITEVSRTVPYINRTITDVSRMIPYINRAITDADRMIPYINRTIIDAGRMIPDISRTITDQVRKQFAGIWFEPVFEGPGPVLFCKHFKISCLKFVF
jgi:hypothetical protein